jgi:hypothetical protein
VAKSFYPVPNWWVGVDGDELYGAIFGYENVFEDVVTDLSGEDIEK